MHLAAPAGIFRVVAGNVLQRDQRLAVQHPGRVGLPQPTIGAGLLHHLLRPLEPLHRGVFDGPGPQRRRHRPDIAGTGGLQVAERGLRRTGPGQPLAQFHPTEGFFRVRLGDGPRDLVRGLEVRQCIGRPAGLQRHAAEVAEGVHQLGPVVRVARLAIEQVTCVLHVGGEGAGGAVQVLAFPGHVTHPEFGLAEFEQQPVVARLRRV